MSRIWLVAILGLPAVVISGAIVYGSIEHDPPPPPPYETSAAAGARARLVARLARSGRIDEARREARELMASEPAFRARPWVEATYHGVRRPQELESDITTLRQAGIPE